MLHASQDKTIWNFNKYINYWAEVQVKKNLTNVDAVKTSQRKKNAFSQMFTTKMNQPRMGDNQRNDTLTTTSWKLCEKAAALRLSHMGMQRKWQITNLYLPTTSLHPDSSICTEQCLSSGRINGIRGFGKGRNRRYLWVTFGNLCLQPALGDSF